MGAKETMVTFLFDGCSLAGDYDEISARTSVVQILSRACFYVFCLRGASKYPYLRSRPSGQAGFYGLAALLLWYQLPLCLLHDVVS